MSKENQKMFGITITDEFEKEYKVFVDLCETHGFEKSKVARLLIKTWNDVVKRRFRGGKTLQDKVKDSVHDINAQLGKGASS